MVTTRKRRGNKHNIQAEVHMEKLWTPYEGHARRVRPQERNSDGGSIFDDELGTQEDHDKQLAKQAKDLMIHLAQRPDHTVYVGSAEERDQLRQVFNWWHREGALEHHPNIRIEYGVPTGNIRVGE